MIPTVRFFFIIFAFVLLSSTAGPNLAPAREKVIAFAQDTLANDYRKAQVFEVRDAVAEHPGLRFTYSDANGQTSLLIRQIKNSLRHRWMC